MRDLAAGPYGINMHMQITRFDALFIIDCWDDAWIQDFGARGMREFYGRTLDFLDQFEYDRVYLCTDSSHTVHPWFTTHFRQHTVALTPQDVNPSKPFAGKLALCAGTSWSHCVHNHNVGLLAQMKLGFRTHSAPELVRGPARGGYTVTHRDFMTDPMIDWQSVNESAVWRAGRIKKL